MGRSVSASVLAGSSKRGWPLRLVQPVEPTSGELYGPSIDALRPVPGRARNGTVGYENETLKQQPEPGQTSRARDTARNARRHRRSVCGRARGLARRPDGRSVGTDELQPGLALDRVEQRPRHLVVDGRRLVERNREPDHHLQSRIGEAEMALGAQPAELEGEVL